MSGAGNGISNDDDKTRNFGSTQRILNALPPSPPAHSGVYVLGAMSAASPLGPAAGPSAPPASLWTEHRNAQGRAYWYHQAEKRSVWEKPTELKTAREKALDSTPWKEYQKGDRKYYVHSITKESSWALPKELKDLFDSIPDEEGASPARGPIRPTQISTASGIQSPNPAASAQSPLGVHAPAAPQQHRVLYSGPPPGFASPHDSASGSASPAPGALGFEPALRGPPPQATAPAHAPTGPAAQRFGAGGGGRAGLVEGGEEAFMQLLREKGVDRNWSWEQTMREIITEPLYKALATLAERKAAFSKYLRKIEEEAHSAKQERIKAMEPSIREMMQEGIGKGRIQAWLSYEGMLLRCADPFVWKQVEAIGAPEARELWETMRKELREQSEKEKRDQRHRNMDVLMTLLRSFEADVMTRWKDARQTIFESDEWRSDAQLREMDVADMLTVFDELMKSIENDKMEESKAQDIKQKRDDRKRRDWFRQALQIGKQEGWLHARTTFADVHDHFREDNQFKELLGQPGSSALDLFYDVLDNLDEEFGKLVRQVDEYLETDQGFAVREPTTFEEFKEAIAAATSGSRLAAAVQGKTEVEMQLVFKELALRAEEQARRAERKLRHLGEDLRYALKKVAHRNPEVFEHIDELEKPWDEWKVHLRNLKLREWDDYERTSFRLDEERIDTARRSAWERFVKRQKEKLAERQPVTNPEASSGIQGGPEDGLVSRKRWAGENEEASPEQEAQVDKRRSSRRAGRSDDSDGKARELSRRERRAGEEGETKRRQRSESKAESILEDKAASPKKPRIDATQEAGGMDSEKEEGEV